MRDERAALCGTVRGAGTIEWPEFLKIFQVLRKIRENKGIADTVTAAVEAAEGKAEDGVAAAA